MNPLDRPIWTALTTVQAQLAVGDGRARAYRYEFAPFVASIDDANESLADLADLLSPDTPSILIQSACGPLPRFVNLVSEAIGVQMVASGAIPAPLGLKAIALGDADAAEMRALTELTRPGPFRERTNRLGQFWGVRESGRLMAMAGERMKLPGFSEVSGVCTHPGARGRGLGRALSQLIAHQIAERGETPMLHAYADNAAAIALYHSLGFAIRSEMRVLAVRRAA